MISVMSNLEMNRVSSSEVRVSNDLSLVDEVRVSSRDGDGSGIDVARVLNDVVDGFGGSESEVDVARVLNDGVVESGNVRGDLVLDEEIRVCGVDGIGMSESEVDVARVLNYGVVESDSVRDDLVLNEEIRGCAVDGIGMSKSEVDVARVMNDGVVSGNVRDDLILNEEIRVSSGDDFGTSKSEVDVARVLCGIGDSANLRDKAFLGNGLGGDGNMESRAVYEESSNAQNEVMTPEIDVGWSDDGVKGSTASTFDGKHKPTSNNGVVRMDGTVDDSRLERRGGLLASEGSGACDMNVAVRTRSATVLDTAFEVGDMVWGKVKSHPWWPGHVFSEALASSSVLRTRREGHVLVAFFGDSSYGWFDVADLIPYDPHFTEKSQQTNSRSFMRAVEESVDEASRRSALGLCCRCRNPNNFRSTNIPGYMAVDVVDYEPEAIYSVNQIRKARESFQPAPTLSFIKQLAAAPSDESKSLNFIQHKATALAYRRSIFEEFDETYSEAFGHDPVPQSLTDKKSSQAPLSGPFVTAEALGGRKSSSKATKPKDVPKRGKYLFKGRDEAGDLRMTRINQGYVSYSLPSTNEGGVSDSGTVSYTFPKIDHDVSTNDGGGVTTKDQVETSAQHATTKDAPPAGLGVKRFSLDATSTFLQLESSTLTTSEVGDVHGTVPDNHIIDVASTNTGLVKKKKAAKRPASEQNSDKSDISQKKKKSRKADNERSMEQQERLSPGSGGMYFVKSEKMSIHSSAPSKEDSQANNMKKDDEVGDSVLQQGLLPLETAGELPQMLAHLQGLALNPFHNTERNKPSATRKLFLKFRALVFQKASSAFATADPEPCDAGSIRSPPATDSNKTAPSLKSSKLTVRPEEPTKGGKKRLPSERQEEISAKRLKKITEVKLLGAEKRAEGKAKVSATQQPSSKLMKQVDRPPRVEEPTYLLMKFQSSSSLPSLMELKARFARFGPLDKSLCRVFYTTNCCRVAFMYKQDANVAYRYVAGSNSVYPNVKVLLKPVYGPEPQQSTGSRSDDMPVDQSSNCDPSAIEPQPSVPSTPLVHQQSVQQLKSCLKKPSGCDEPMGLPMGPTNGSGSVRAPRVRFSMGEDKAAVSQMQMESRNDIPIPSSKDGPSCSLSSSVVDVVPNNQRLVSSVPLQPPPVPHPPHFPRMGFNHPQHHVELPQRNIFNHNVAATTGLPGLAPTPTSTPLVSSFPAPPPLPPRSMDISQQMINLLTRCHDIVTNVQVMLGYVPYHPL